jgi:multiple RNA-binding domain-containing protein 1
VSKSDILNPESGSTSAAVKLALAETHVIQETKAYLETQGDLSVLSSSPDSSSSSTLVPTSRNRRSDTVVLVKNIPYGTSEDAIRALFEPHVEPDSGGLRRVLVPPAGTMAIVEFTRADEAGKAFRAVAYRRIGNSVVYLEKAPLGLLPDGPLLTAPADAGGAKHTSSPTSSATTAKEADEDDETDTKEESVIGATLFVKNLAFATTSEQLMSVLRHLPAFAFARVQTKPDHKDPAGIRRLSMGYGFVGFKDAEGAKRGLKAIQGMRVGGHVLEAKFAGRGAEDDDKDGKGAIGGAGVTGGRKTTKMIVKNLPFEASKKDVRELFRYADVFLCIVLTPILCDFAFSAHGQLKSVRVPKRFDHRARGFAFLEFLTRQDAEAAYGALQHTHLLGRHLVLEWAEEGEQDLDELRKKAGVGFGDGKELPGKKRKLNMDGDDADAMDEDA